MRLTTTTIAAMAFLAAPVSATLYFSEDGNSEGLYVLDTDTGAATNVGTSGVTGSTVGLAPGADNDSLFGTIWADTADINADGSGSTVVGDASAEGMAYDPVTNTLWGAINGSFFTIDTGNFDTKSSLASPGQDVEGLAYDGAGGVFGLADGGDLLRYDIFADIWSPIGNTGVNFDQAGLAYDMATGNLYAKGDQDSFLYLIDALTASITEIGDTGISNGGGLAFVSDAVAVPAPAAIALFGLGLAGLGLRRRKTA
ncbi:PEP-CTERM sorting domain-containing protein [Pacificimonas sp. WHA3]|uniref:PEP-CTERM sorting domain-containing protein n=1 Tax=Pacificimonas pallii TaxID=2827236 RepID=A0ABS6SCF9_9SPHN|nr:PEP-CTERM sorting domain-containing protein [Pacificimonas pallii]MBV7255601.1 PEP-CTERM sorting domain-containing protein [Pacificimonas pallii]